MIKLHRGNLRMLLIILAVLFMSYKVLYFNIGIAIFITGFAIHLISKGFLYRNRELAIRGPYSFVRHPFYAANLLLDIGIIFMSGHPLFILIYLPLYYIAYNRVILGEETELINIYGDLYKRYTRKVPRYIPKIVPYTKDWHKGFKWENILREREVSRLLRLMSYPVSFLIIDKIIKYKLHQPDIWKLLSGICFVIALLWSSYLFHNIVERDRIFKDRNKKTLNIYYSIFIFIAGLLFVISNYLKSKFDILFLSIALLVSLFSIFVILFIIINDFSRHVKIKFK